MVQAKTKAAAGNRRAPSPSRLDKFTLRDSRPLQARPQNAASLRRPLAFAGLLVGATLLLYSPVGTHPFINYDDPDYVVNNSHLQMGITWETLTWALTATEQSNWHPLTWLSHALDCQLFGLNAGGHHWMSLAIHVLNTVILFLLLWRTTGAPGRSLLVAALFALHPLNVESVAWIAERKNVLSTLFFLLTMGAYGWYARNPAVRRYLVVTLLFVLGLASKPMVVTLPFVLLLLDFWPLQRIKNWSTPSPVFAAPQQAVSRLLLEKLPLLALSAGSAAITLVAQGQTVIPTQLLPLGVRLENALYASGMYLLKAVWPVHLSLIYPHPGRTLEIWQPALAALTILAVSLVAWKRRLSEPYLVVGWLWFLGTAVPVIGVVQVGMQVIADRYAYVPLIGVFLIFVWEAGNLADRFGLTLWPRIMAATLVLAGMSFMTWRQIGYWRSDAEVWIHALQVTKDNPVAEHALATNLLESGRYQEGMTHLRKYARLEPLDADAQARVGADSMDHGRLPEAIDNFEAAIRAQAVLAKYGLAAMAPRGLALTYANLGVIHSQLGDETNADADIRKALDTDAPTVEQMISRLSQEVAANPTAPGAYRLGLLLRLTGREPEAQQEFALSVQLDSQSKRPVAEESAKH